MLKIYDIREKMQFLIEIAELTQKEWGTHNLIEEFNNKVNKKIEKIKSSLDKINYCKLILLENEKLYYIDL